MKNVLLIDSGSGGVNILKECLRVCPRANFLMFCDNKNLPYGEKSKEELVAITLKNLKNIQTFFNFDIVVIACNTLTATCIDECRDAFPKVQFVGTVPAIKPALEKYKEEEIAVLATGTTIKHNKLIQKHKKVQCFDMQSLASLIDQNLDDLGKVEFFLREKLEKINAKAVVLGCTHYVAVKKEIEKILPKCEIFDSANGVARRLNSLIGESGEGFEVKIMTSKEGDMWAKLWDFFRFDELQ